MAVTFSNNVKLRPDLRLLCLLYPDLGTQHDFVGHLFSFIFALFCITVSSLIYYVSSESEKKGMGGDCMLLSVP